MLGLVKRIDVGICGDAGAAATALIRRLAGRELACDATRSQRGADIAADKADWGAKKKTGSRMSDSDPTTVSDYPDPIPDTPENIMKAILITPPNEPASGATSKNRASTSPPDCHSGPPDCHSGL